MLRSGLMTVLALCLASAAFAAETLRLSFEDGLGEPLTAKKLKLVKGVSGQGVSIPLDGVLDYPAKGALKAESGAVSQWVKLDWTPRSEPVKMSVALPKGTTWLGNNLFQCGNLGSMVSGAGMDMRLFQGEWAHFVFCWDKGGKRRGYFNAMGADLFPGEVKLDAPLRLGALVGGDKRIRGLDGTMDELRVFDQALDDNQVKALYAEVFPLAVSPMDLAGVAGKAQPFRVRFVNLTDKAQSKRYTLDVQGTNTSFDVQAGANEMVVKALDLTLPAAGDYPLSLSVDGLTQRKWQVAAIAPESITASMPVSATGAVDMKLLEEIDCSQDLPDSKYRDDGHCQVVKGYRETTLREINSGFAYRLAIKNPGKPHWLEIEYPDDVRRMFYVAVVPYSESYKRVGVNANLDTIGVITGGAHPLTGKTQTKRMLFWPDAKDCMVTCCSFRWSDDAGAAVSKIRLYETVGPLPRLEVNYPEGLPSRTFALWQEDPAMTADVWFNRPEATAERDFDFWRTKVDRMVRYLRLSGKNAWSFDVIDYYGDNTGAVDHLLPGSELWRCPGWLDLVATTFEREGIPFYVAFNHHEDSPRKTLWKLFGPDGCAPDFAAAAAKGLDAVELFSFDDKIVRGGWARSIDPIHPKVKAVYLKLVATYRDKYGPNPQFRGVNFISGSELHFGSPENGYGDYDLALFEKDTGLKAPGTPGSPARFSERHAWLKANAWDKWISWRCEKIRDLCAELVAEVNRGGSGGRQVVIRVAADSMLPALGKPLRRGEQPADVNAALREAGVDLALLGQVPGLVVMPYFRPNYSRRPGTPDERYYDFSPELAALFQKDAYPAVLLWQHSNLEAYCSIAKSKIKKFWWDCYWRQPDDNVLAAYSTPQPDNKYLLENLCWALAETDPWMIDHGFWGCPENGALELYQRFHQAYLSIPRLHFEKAPGPDDPVTVRVHNSDQGHWLYLVNKAYYPVKVSFRVGSGVLPEESSFWDWLLPVHSIFSHELQGHEVLVLKCHGEIEVSDLVQEIPVAEKERLLGSMTGIERRVELYQRVYGSKPAVVAKMLDAARRFFAAGRFALAERRLESRAVGDLEASLTDNLRCRLFADGALELRFTNVGDKPFSGAVKLLDWPKNMKWSPKEKSLAIGELAPGATFSGVFNFAAPGFQENAQTRFLMELSCDDGRPPLVKDLRLRPYLAKEGGPAKWKPLDVLTPVGAQSWKARYAWTWDASGLSLSVVAEDKDFVPPAQPGAMYKDDCLQVYFDQLDNKSGGYDYNDLTYQIGLVNGKPLAWREQAAPGEGDKVAPEVKVSVKRSGGSTFYEVFFPASEFTHLKLEKGAMLGFAILVNNTDHGVPHSQLGLRLVSPFLTPWSWDDLLLVP